MTIITKLFNILGYVRPVVRSLPSHQCVDYQSTKKSLTSQNRGHRIPSNKGHRDDIPEVLEFQSKMEANLHRFYKVYGGLDCQYEPRWFRFPQGSNNMGIYGYTPDFQLSSGLSTWFIECKGFVDDRSVECIRLFKKYYPGFPIYMVTPVEYKKIEKLYAHQISH